MVFDGKKEKGKNQYHVHCIIDFIINEYGVIQNMFI